MDYLNLKLPNQEGTMVSLSDYAGKYIVLYFYPKDNTPGCTVEAIDFTALKDAFTKENAVVIGVSKDSVKSHKSFCEKKDLEIELLSDEEGQLVEAFGVWQLKKFMGREYMGIVRSTFILGPNGAILKEYPSVKVKEHAQTILTDLIQWKEAA